MFLGFIPYWQKTDRGCQEIAKVTTGYVHAHRQIWVENVLPGIMFARGMLTGVKSSIAI
jgi:hypothetical protein